MSNKNQKLTYARGDDWNGLYLGDTLVVEGHRVEVRDVAHYAMQADSFEEKWADLDWLGEQGNFPANIADVVWE